MNSVRAILLMVCMGCIMTACYYPQTNHEDEWDLTESRRDSIDFEKTHHYTHNFNFMVVADSITLYATLPNSYSIGNVGVADSFNVTRDDRLVVADIAYVSDTCNDSVWIKVARDQRTMGWIAETELLKGVIPDDSISEFIYIFSDVHLISFMAVAGVVLMLYLLRRMRRKRFHMVHFDDIGSCYPTLLCITLSGAATLYASMQKFVPQTWVEFYYHPTLNPFELPFILGLFIGSVWLIILLLIASVDDIRRQLPASEAILYFMALMAMCGACYMFFSISTLYYIGYPCFVAYTVWALQRYYRYGRCQYVCGRCGTKLAHKGQCPRCGAWNR